MQKTTVVLLMVLLSLICAVPAEAFDGVHSGLSAQAPDLRSMTGGIQEMIDALPPEGGTVFVPEGLYILKASISLRSDVSLIGAGFSTVLRAVDETKTYLAEDAAAGQNQVVVTDASGFEPGMDVIVKDDDSSFGWGPDIRTIAAIDGNTITLGADLENEMSSNANGLVVNAFPMISADGYHNGTTYLNVLIENIKIEGNKENVRKYTWQQAGIVFIRTFYSTIRNVWIDGSNYEGISDQGLGDTWNTISDNLITGSAGKGIHLGAINRYLTVSGNTILDSYGDGIFFCNAIQYGHLVNNTISGNGGHGMGGIDDSFAEGDSFNVIQGNTITLNFKHGIEAVHTSGNTIANNVISENSQESPGAYSGLYLDTVTNYLVSGNEILQNDGPGVTCTESDLTFDNNLIASNEAGGLHIADSTAIITNNTIVDNNSQVDGGGIHCEDSVLTITNSILWGNTPDQVYLDSGAPPVISFCDVQGEFAGTGNIDSDPFFVSGPMGNHYLSQTSSGQSTDSPCLNVGSDLAENICFTIEAETTCFDLLTASSCHGPENGLVDMGYHYDARRYTTLSADLACTPSTGTLPLSITIDCTLINNYENLNRLGTAVLSISLAGGGTISHWKAGTVGLGPGDVFHTSFPQTVPSLSSLLGTNTIELSVDDVTPPPYNQPPYPPSGDRDTDYCTVEGLAP